MAGIRITILVENTARKPGLLAEHGMAFWVEHHRRKLLLDCGQGGVLQGNAFKLGIALNELDALVLSHGHYDHTGGAAEVLKGMLPVPVYIHPLALARKFAGYEDGHAQEIGIPYPARQAIFRFPERLIATEKPTEIFPGVMVTGSVPREVEFEDTGGRFFLDEACSQPDLLLDDQALFITTSSGTVVLLGCAHAGVINTLRYVRFLTGSQPIAAVIGGMHLVRASPERIARTVEELRRLEVACVAPAHCTGTAAVAAMHDQLPERFCECSVGTRFEFD